MIFTLKSLVSCLLAIAVTVAVPARATQQDKEADRQKELEKKTLALLNDVAAGAWSLKLPENRLFIMSNAADLLWTVDEKRARTLYWDALNALNLVAGPVRATGQKLSPEERAKLAQNYLSAFELRQKLLRRVARRDAQLALDMLRASRPLIKTDLTDDKQTNALLTLLCAFAVVDPPKAFALAERTIDRANRQISLLLLLDKVVKSGALKKNELVLEQPQLMPIEFLVFKYGKGMAALARADFNRTRALAERFDRNELRLMAQLLVLKGLLERLPDPQITGNAPAF